MFGSNVAPKRRVIDKKFVPWGCACVTVLSDNGHILNLKQQMNPGYLKKCIDCGSSREK